ncbi:MAG: nitrous oxide reductase accessory protein NosL [Bacteroidota bacterium]
MIKSAFNNKWTMPAITIACLLLLATLFFPIWKIDLTAPQYPEGLSLKIWANKLGGNVDTVNGLNHYIGMKKLVADEFVEFKILPGLIIFFALFGIITALLNKRKLLYIWMSVFLAFAFLSITDFYYWEYNYGHNLDPMAPIQVPGMAYQPPLLGYKQMLNFSAYSIPDIGGWLFIACGAVMFALTLSERHSQRKRSVSNATVMVAACMLPLLIVSCNNGVKPINYGKDNCNHCKMTIVDRKFAAEIISNKGKIYKMDDLICAKGFISEQLIPANEIKQVYVNNYSGTGELFEIKSMTIVHNALLQSPMGGSMAAFTSKTEAEKYIQENGGEIISLEIATGFK